MYLSDIRDYIASLSIAKDENCYMGKLDAKPQKAIGVYKLERNTGTNKGIGQDKTYGIYPISILIHWTKSPRETEVIAKKLFDKLSDLSDVVVNDIKFKFARLLVSEPISVDTDDNGIYEMVIQAEIYYERS